MYFFSSPCIEDSFRLRLGNFVQDHLLDVMDILRNLISAITTGQRKHMLTC